MILHKIVKCQMGEAFNNFPGIMEFKEKLLRRAPGIDFVDVDEDCVLNGHNYWRNKADTAIFGINLGSDLSYIGWNLSGIELVAKEMNADEFEHSIIHSDGQDLMIFRLWWD